jgi:hypothetical protein
MTTRPFKYDYPIPPESQVLTRDTDGRPLTGRYVAGRKTLGGQDVAITPAESYAIAEEGIGVPVALVPKRKVGGDLGRATFVGSEPVGIKINKTLPFEKLGMTLQHELGHVIHTLSGEPQTKGLMKELSILYDAGNNPSKKPSGWMPKHDKYPESQKDAELWAEAIRIYQENPNYIKTVVPNVAAKIREVVNTNEHLNKIINFNTLAPLCLNPL